MVLNRKFMVRKQILTVHKYFFTMGMQIFILRKQIFIVRKQIFTVGKYFFTMGMQIFIVRKQDYT